MKSKTLTKAGIILFWVGVIVFLLWTIAKSIGLINTPIWIEQIPNYAITISVVGGAIAVGKKFEKLDKVCRDIEDIKKDIKKIHKNAICLGTGTCDLH